MKPIFTFLFLFACTSLLAQEWESEMIQFSSTGVNTDQSSIIIDYDVDGTPDILYGNKFRKELFLLRNNEAGILQLETITDTLYSTHFLHKLDYNDDSKDDFLIAASTTEGYGLWLCINQGNSSFTWTYVCEVPYEELTTIVVDDFDNDTDKDIIYDDFANSNVLWKVTNNGDNTFTQTMISYTGQPTVLYGMADLDADGDNDLLTSYYSFTTSTFILVSQENTGGMNFTAHEHFEIAEGGNGCIGDFAGNTLPDLAYASTSGDGNVLIFQNNGSFSFSLAATTINLSDYADLSPAMDYDNDGNDDFLGVYNFDLYLLKQNNNGTFTPQVLVNECSGHYLDKADFNGDGEDDFVMTGLDIWQYESPGNYEHVYTNYNNAARIMVTADIDNNNNRDIITADVLGQVTFFNQLIDEKIDYGHDHILTGTNIDYTTAVRYIIPFDKEGDGDTDILCQVANYIYWLTNNNGNFTQQTVNNDVNGNSLWIGYLDDDNFHDILFYSNGLKRWEWNGTSYTNTSFTSGPTPDYEVMDVDNDGDNDILYFDWNINTQEYEIKYMRNTNGTFATQPLFTLDDYFANNLLDFDLEIPMMKADLDGDNDDDLVFSSTDAEYIAWFRNDGNAEFTPIVINEDLTEPAAFVISNPDNDDDLDIIISNRGEGEIMILQNDGDENFAPVALANIVGYPETIDAVDFDNDTDIDIVYCSRVDRRIGWLRNTLVDCPREYSYSEETICLSDSLLFGGEYLYDNGMYTDTLTSASGCDSVQILTLSHYPQQTINIDNSSNILIVTSAGPLSDIQWYHDDLLESESGNTSIDAADYGTGQYYVIATGENGCLVLSEDINVTTIISVNELYGGSLSIYPNPFQSDLRIENSGVAISSLKVYDLAGRKCFELNKTLAASTRMDLSALPSATYMVECLDINGKVTRKLITKD